MISSPLLSSFLLRTLFSLPHARKDRAAFSIRHPCFSLPCLKPHCSVRTHDLLLTNQALLILLFGAERRRE